jgi:hypothetical protein
MRANSVVDNTRLAITSNPLDWALMTLLLIAWTAAARPWERFFERGHEYLAQRRSEDVNFPAPKIATIGQSSIFKYHGGSRRLYRRSFLCRDGIESIIASDLARQTVN